MSPAQPGSDFESQWQAKLAAAVEEEAGPEARQQVLAGGKALSDQSSSRRKVAWTCQALEVLAEQVDLPTRERVLTACHCRYPVEDLADIKAAYQKSGSIDTALAQLQERFERFLREELELEGDLVNEIIQRGWGLAGVRKGKTILATKIPKSGTLRAYFEASDPLEKRRLYCHCPRVREELGSEPQLPAAYCYCGAGYYQGIWEEILGQAPEVEVLESVLQGGQVCRIAIHLP